MFQNLYKSNIPKPHDYVIKAIDTKSQKVGSKHISLSYSTNALKRIRERSIPFQTPSFCAPIDLHRSTLAKTIIKSGPKLRSLFIKLNQEESLKKHESQSSFFYANFIISKKKLPELYSKGFYLGTQNFSEKQRKLTLSKNISFLKVQA